MLEELFQQNGPSAQAWSHKKWGHWTGLSLLATHQIASALLGTRIGLIHLVVQT